MTVEWGLVAGMPLTLGFSPQHILQQVWGYPPAYRCLDFWNSFSKTQVRFFFVSGRVLCVCVCVFLENVSLDSKVEFCPPGCVHTRAKKLPVFWGKWCSENHPFRRMWYLEPLEELSKVRPVGIRPKILVVMSSWIRILGRVTHVQKYGCLGGGFKDFLFSRLFGEDSHFDSYFSKGLKPPTSCLLLEWFDRIYKVSLQKVTTIPEEQRVKECFCFGNQVKKTCYLFFLHDQLSIYESFNQDPGSQSDNKLEKSQQQQQQQQQKKKKTTTTAIKPFHWTSPQKILKNVLSAMRCPSPKISTKKVAETILGQTLPGFLPIGGPPRPLVFWTGVIRFHSYWRDRSWWYRIYVYNTLDS